MPATVRPTTYADFYDATWKTNALGGRSGRACPATATPRLAASLRDWPRAVPWRRAAPTRSECPEARSIPAAAARLRIASATARGCMARSGCLTRPHRSIDGERCPIRGHQYRKQGDGHGRR